MGVSAVKGDKEGDPATINAATGEVHGNPATTEVDSTEKAGHMRNIYLQIKSMRSEEKQVSSTMGSRCLHLKELKQSYPSKTLQRKENKGI